MSYINVSAPTDFVKLEISNANDFSTSTNVLTVPCLQDITVNNNNGTFRWKQLDSTSQKVVATPSTNSLAFNIVLDDAAFFDGVGTTDGLFDLSNNKTLVYFRMYWKGNGTGDKYITGSGYLTGLAPKVNPDQPVWVTPLTIEVDGNFSTGTVS